MNIRIQKIKDGVLVTPIMGTGVTHFVENHGLGDACLRTALCTLNESVNSCLTVDKKQVTCKRCLKMLSKQERDK